MTELLPDWRFRLPGGGLALWCELPGACGTAVTAEAERRGVIVAPGPAFAAEGGLDTFVRIPWTRRPRARGGRTTGRVRLGGRHRRHRRGAVGRAAARHVLVA